MIITKLNLDKYTDEEQLDKMLEEWLEVRDATNKKEKIEESLDLIIATFNYLFKISDKDEIQKVYKEIVKKLEDRNKEGRIKIQEYIEI